MNYLLEAQLDRIIKDVINEVNDRTKISAELRSADKVNNAVTRYGSDSANAKASSDQHEYFKKHNEEEWKKGNDRRKARLNRIRQEEMAKLEREKEAKRQAEMEKRNKARAEREAQMSKPKKKKWWQR